jgi:hypothetical protein
MIEAAYASEEAVEMELLESMTDDEVVEFFRENRPSIQVALAEADGGDGDGDADDEMDDDVKKLMKKGMSQKQAESFARNKKSAEESAEQEDDDMTVTPEKLQEALSSQPELLAEAVKSSPDVQALIDERVRGALAEEKAVADAERDAVIDRQWELRDLRDSAHRLIAESRLPDSWQEALRHRFALKPDRSPTPELDVVDEIDGEGQVVKTAAQRIEEAVAEAIAEDRRRLAEVAPTRVRGQGPTSVKEGEEGGEELAESGEPGFHRQLLQEAGIDYEKAYAGI